MRILAMLTLMVVGVSSVNAGEAYWNQFRGPDGNGQSKATGLPLKFSDTENVKWKTAIKGRAWSSPVVWSEQIWFTNAFKDGKKMYAVCVDFESGKVVHNIVVFENEKPQFCFPQNSYATPTPVVEAGRVYVHFGVHGTACLDTKTGEKIWERRDFECNHHRGPAASPIIHGDLLFVHFDGFDVQFVVAMNKMTGKTVWRKSRAFDYKTTNGDRMKAYCTPTVITHKGKEQLISPGAVATEAFDPATGKLLWTVRHGGMNASARPVYGQGLVFIVVGMGGMIAVPPEGSGDITAKTAWKSRKAVPKKSTPLLIDKLLFMVSDKGIASCRDAVSGEIIWQNRLKGEFAASPLLIDGRIYAFGIKGDISVFEPSRKFKLLAENKVDAGFMATPAVVEGSLILRTKTHVYRIGTKP